MTVVELYDAYHRLHTAKFNIFTEICNAAGDGEVNFAKQSNAMSIIEDAIRKYHTINEIEAALDSIEKRIQRDIPDAFTIHIANDTTE